MTTIVASPPTFQSSLPRLGWDGAGNTQGGFAAMSTEDVSRIFIPQRKVVTRSASSSSLSSNSSQSSTSTVTSANEALTPVNAEGPAPVKKKQRGGFWPVSKAESTSGITNARANGAVQSVASNGMGALGQKNGVQQLNSDHVNGVRPTSQTPAMLVLRPMNGTFERKQINVPMHPDPPQKIGRQTNAKTQPKSDNGYFDSKVLSRQHAEIWADTSGRIWIRDVKSSNGTFVNGTRLSPENKESEPTELRQHDSLELGIDIVSEDQKTIVHHKVSAKVEFAGFPGKAANAFDILNFGEVDPSSGHGLMNSPMSAPMIHSRSQQGQMQNGRVPAGSNFVGANVNPVAQRQAQYWGAPLNIDQLVKQVGIEMRAAKQQAHDLEQTNTLLHSVLPTDGSPTKNPQNPQNNTQEGSQSSKMSGGRVKPLRVDHSARFADPPAPPPQQPLPEKPDGAKASSLAVSTFAPSLKRDNTAKPVVNGASTSPTSSQSSQILTLIASLNEARQQIESQGNKVKELENLLKQERQAREAAEDKVKRLEETSASRPVSTVTEESEKSEESESIEEPESTKQLEHPDESMYKQKLDLMVAEVELMQERVNRITQRAENAEAEKSTLADMIEQFRKEREENEAAKAVEEDVTAEKVSQALKEYYGHDTTNKQLTDQANGHVKMPRLPEHLHQAVTAVLHDQSRGELSNHTAPYVSMLGVVLIGVGLMAYLNSWPKVDK